MERKFYQEWKGGGGYMKSKKINYDPKSDVFYIVLKDGFEEKHQEVAPGIFVELDTKGKLMGVEILNASQNIGKFFKHQVSP